MSTVKLLHRKVSILHSFWENLHWTEKIYTGTAGGAGGKYEVCAKGVHRGEAEDWYRDMEEIHWDRHVEVVHRWEDKEKNRDVEGLHWGASQQIWKQAADSILLPSHFPTSQDYKCEGKN